MAWCQWFVYFNLTGGFKSLNGYLQSLGTVHADRCGFLYENSTELMEIPRLPMRLFEMEEIRPYGNLFRKLDAGYEASATEAEGLADALIFADGDQVALSVWGDLVWARVRKELLAERMLQPLSSKVFLKDKVADQFGRLPDRLKPQANEALDALSAHLDGVRPVLKSNSFKKLSGNPAPPSTHELYVNSDRPPMRFYGHFEADRFIVEELGDHF